MRRNFFITLLILASSLIFYSAFGQDQGDGQQKVEGETKTFQMLLCVSAFSFSILCFCFGIKDRLVSNPVLFNLKKISLALGGTLLLIVLFNLISIFSSNPHDKDTNPAILALVLVVFLVGYFFRDGGGLCPGCSRLMSAEPIEMTLVDGHVKYKNVKRQEHVKNRSGETIFTIEKDETIPIEVKTHCHHYKCPICCHQWTKLKTTESQA